MARRCMVLVLLLFCGVVGTAFAGLDEGRAAIEKGDYAAALIEFQPLAEQGDADAQAALGSMYFNGQGVPQDDGKAVELFRKAAEQGSTRGQRGLGYMYANGRGVANDDVQAVQWYRKAADQGDARGQSYLAYLYLYGRGGLPQDDKQALDLFRKAAEQGDAPGQYNLGLMYKDGRGVVKDDAEAARWFRKAADQGNAMAQNNLATMYRYGAGGLPTDDRQAAELYRKAADQGNANAQYQLGFLYQYGRGGLPQDVKQAMDWYRKAAGQGHTTALASLNAIKQNEQDFPGLSRTVAELVKANEKAQPSQVVLDPERVSLAREVIDVSGARETQIDLTEEINERLANLKTPPGVSPRFIEAMRVTLIASFKRDHLLESWEHKLAEKVDAGTLQAGLLWDRSELGHRMHVLEVASANPEQRAAAIQFGRELMSKGGRTDDPRGRACAQADTLADKTESIVPLLEALVAGVMIGGAQKAPAMDMEAIRRAVVTVRPALHEAARQSVLGQCLYAYRDLSDAELEQWLEFLRSDSGGRYARGLNDSRRDALLDATEVFTRTLVEVSRQMKGRGDS